MSEQWLIRDTDSGREWPKDSEDDVRSALNVFGDEMNLEVESPESVERANIVDGDLVVQGGEQSKEDSTEASDTGTHVSEDGKPQKTRATHPEEFETESGATQSEIDTVEAQAAEPIKVDDIDDEYEFVTEIAGVPEAFVLNMGTKNNKSPHITKTGYYYLAEKQNLRTLAKPLNPTWEGSDTDSAYEATVYNEDGEPVASNTGTAHLEHEDMQGAEANLDELAATRAATRALSIATGAGVASMEEMMGGDNA